MMCIEDKAKHFVKDQTNLHRYWQSRTIDLMLSVG